MKDLPPRRPGRPSRHRLAAEEAARKVAEANKSVAVARAAATTQQRLNDFPGDPIFVEGPVEKMPFATMCRTYHGYNVVTGTLVLRRFADPCHRCGTSQEATVHDVRVGRPEPRWVAEARFRTALSLNRNWLANQPRPLVAPNDDPKCERPLEGEIVDEAAELEGRLIDRVREETVISSYLTEVPVRGKVGR